MSPFFTNLVLFSPLLLLAAVALYILEHRDSFGQGSSSYRATPPDEAVDSTTLPGEQIPPEDDQESLPDEPDGEENMIDLQDDQPAPPNAGDEGPAATAASRPTPRTRNIGTKKARSLARRDQRRAYYEFLHSQAAARAEEEKALRQEEEERAFENARKRALVEEEIAAKKEKERAKKLEEQLKEKEMERRDVQKVKGLLTGKRAVEVKVLAESVGRETGWVESTLKREGYLDTKDGEICLLTSTGWWVRVRSDDLNVVWSRLETKGRMDWNEMGTVLQESLVD